MRVPLYLLVKNPFGPRDFDRMGVAALSEVFDVVVLDCTAWLLPTALTTREATDATTASVSVVRSLRDLWLVMGRRVGGVAIDYVGSFSLRTLLLFWTLRAKRIPLVVFDSGGVPYPSRQGTRWAAAKAWFKSNRDLGLVRRILKVAGWALMKLLPKHHADVAFIAGTYCMYDPRYAAARQVVPSHSFDYEKHLTLMGTPRLIATRYAVYVDEKITGHEDDAELGLPAVASERTFLPALDEFLRQFSDATELPVVIAAYPSSDVERTQRLWPGREAMHGKTAELVRDAELVFVHATTAASFAIVSRRPLVHLTSHEIVASWYAPWVEAMQQHTGAPQHNVDAAFPPRCELDGWFRVDEDRYRSFEETFIRAPGCSPEHVWPRVIRVLQEGMKA